MVMNKNSMGYELNKKQRKKLIYLYGEYIKNPKDKFMQDGADPFISPSTHFYTPLVENAMDVAYKISSGEMKIEEAKEILESLKKEEKEDKD